MGWDCLGVDMSDNDRRRDDSVTGAATALPAMRDRSLDDRTLSDPDALRLLAEEVSVDRELVETGRVRVRVVTREHDEMVDVPLARHNVEVERVPVDKQVSEIPPVRRVDDVTIVPVVEEIVVVERRLMLREELHIRTVHTTERHQERVVLRRQEAVVTRVPVESPAADTRPSAGVDGNATSQKG
jgi:uncharacterized protein (TIGR02271 family)